MRSYRKTTIRDVARRAGVSVTTVSLLLGGKTDVCSPDTARRVEEAVAALNYVPAASLRGLRSVETRTLGVCVGLPHRSVNVDEQAGLLRNTFAEQLWSGLLYVADGEGYSLLHYPSAVRDSPRHEPFLDGRIDGLILHPGWRDPRPARLSAAGLPTVVVARHLDIPPGCGAVFTAEGDTVDLALGHLWALGHRRIAHVAGPTEEPPGAEEACAGLPAAVRYTPSDIAIARKEHSAGWLRVRSAFDPALVVGSGSRWGLGEAEAARIVAQWRAMPAPPTAVFCANDGVALSILSAARAAGLRVPRDLSVVGVDDSPAAALLADPPLTSVRLPGEDVGRAALRCLLDLMHRSGAKGGGEEGAMPAPVPPQGSEPPGEPCRIAVTVTRLAVRASTAPPAG